MERTMSHIARDFSQKLDELVNLYNEAADRAVCGSWKPASENPESDQKCIVITKQGAMYFQTPTNGRFLDNVVFWLQIPKIPNQS